MASTNPARGMRDFLPADVRKRNYVINIIKEVYESYGFEPLETPAVENIETLMGKYGEEGNQLIFRVLARGGKFEDAFRKLRNQIAHFPESVDANTEIIRLAQTELADLALRYDLTVPLARVVANHKNDLPKFFKRYQIQPVWRADRPARGRFREFYQCDVDCIGSESMVVEAEIISAVDKILTKLGFHDFLIRVNDRRILRDVLNAAGISEEKHLDALIAVDKIDKIGAKAVSEDLRLRNISSKPTEKLIAFLEYFLRDDARDVFDEKQRVKYYSFLQNILKSENPVLSLTVGEPEQESEEGLIAFELEKDAASFVSEHIDEFKEFLNLQLGNLLRLLRVDEFIKESGAKNSALGGSYLKEYYELITMGVSVHIKIDPSLARGLSYYTGTIMEINVPDLAGSLGGGGRYDGLIGMFGKEQIPACGFSLGLERILVVMEERGMFPPEIADSTPADVMVTIWNEETIADSLKLANELRSQGLRVTVYPQADKEDKQWKYANSIGVPWLCSLTESDIANGTVSYQDLKTREKGQCSRQSIAEILLTIKK